MWFWYDIMHLWIQFLINELIKYAMPIQAEHLIMALRAITEHQTLRLAEDGSVVLASFYA